MCPVDDWKSEHWTLIGVHDTVTGSVALFPGAVPCKHDVHQYDVHPLDRKASHLAAWLGLFALFGRATCKRSKKAEPDSRTAHF